MNSFKDTQIDRHEFTWLIMSVNRYHMGLSNGLGLTGFELAKFNTKSLYHNYVPQAVSTFH